MVIFDRPTPAVTQRWQLACYGSFSHLITMPHVNRTQIDQLVQHIQENIAIHLEQSPKPIKKLKFSDNRDEDIIIVGNDEHLLTEVSSAMAMANIMIEGITAEKTEEVSIIRLRVNNRQRGLEILKQNIDIGRSYGQCIGGRECEINHIKPTNGLSLLDYQAVSNDALLVHLEDQPGTLARVMKQCQSQQVPIRSVRLLWRGKGKAVVELASPDMKQLKATLAEQLLLR